MLIQRIVSNLDRLINENKNFLVVLHSDIDIKLLKDIKMYEYSFRLITNNYILHKDTGSPIFFLYGVHSIINALYHLYGTLNLNNITTCIYNVITKRNYILDLTFLDFENFETYITIDDSGIYNFSSKLFLTSNKEITIKHNTLISTNSVVIKDISNNIYFLPIIGENNVPYKIERIDNKNYILIPDNKNGIFIRQCIRCGGSLDIQYEQGIVKCNNKFCSNNKYHT